MALELKALLKFKGLKSGDTWDFPNSSVVKTSRVQCRGKVQSVEEE